MIRVIALVLLACVQPLSAQVNLWTNTASGPWEVTNNWSLWMRPGQTQSVLATNAGFKAIGITHSTAADYADSLTVRSLEVSAPPGGFTTVLLNYAGTNEPLRVLDSCGIGSNAAIVSLYSSFKVDSMNGGSFSVDHGRIDQEGGFLTTTNTTVVASGAAFHFTNATVHASNVWLSAGSSIVQQGGELSASLHMQTAEYLLIDGLLEGRADVGISGSGRLVQSGGTNQAETSVGVNGYPVPGSGSGSYFLLGGLARTAGISIGAGSDTSGSFLQGGGAVETGSILIGGGSFWSSGSFSLTNGSLRCGNLWVANGGFSQYGGSVLLTNGLSLAGYLDDYNGAGNRFARYTLGSGAMSTPAISVSFFGTFNQEGGTNLVAGDFYLTSTTCVLSGGHLGTSNTVVARGNYFTSDRIFVDTQLIQSNGVHRVVDTLSVAGEYTLTGGVLIASNILLGGSLLISDPATVSNTGSCALGGRLSVRSQSLALGKPVLADNCVLDLSGSGELAFASGTGAVWTPYRMLTVTNWHGALAGGGTSRLRFGSSNGGLTLSQLSQIMFVDPADLPAGYYDARILSNGEIVPGDAARLFAGRTADKIVVSWPAGLFLQSAANVAGPYQDVWGVIEPAASPFTNSIYDAPQKFFRVRR